MRMPALLDGREAEPTDDRGGAGLRKPGRNRSVVRICGGGQAGRECGGDSGEPIVIERAVDRPAVTLDDIERRPVKPPEHTMPMPPPIRPNRNPARILEKRIGKKSRRRIKLVTNEWLNLHRRVGSSPKMHWRRQGDLGELVCDGVVRFAGARIVCFPIGHSPDWDFIADLDGCLLRVQVKTCIAFHNGRWRVTVCTRGGNQSWSGLGEAVRLPSCDYLFAVVGDGRRWCIPADGLEGKTRMVLGGSKYAEFEVDPGRPLPARNLAETPSTIAS